MFSSAICNGTIVKTTQVGWRGGGCRYGCWTTEISNSRSLQASICAVMLDRQGHIYIMVVKVINTICVPPPQFLLHTSAATSVISTAVSLIVLALQIFLTKWNEITTQCFQRVYILAVAALYSFVLLKNLQPKCCHICKKGLNLFTPFVLHITS
jgi:hypothetical protein